MGLDTSGMVIPHQLLHGSSSNAEIHGGTSRDKLNEYTLKRKRSRNIIFNIRNSWYYNIEYMEAQVGLNCSGHALKALLHPYVDRFSPAWTEVENERSLQPLSGSLFWRNRSTFFVIDTIKYLFPRSKIELNHIQRFVKTDETLCRFFSDGSFGIREWQTRFQRKLIGFICYTYGNPTGHFTVLKPIYYRNGNQVLWKWFYLDSFDKKH